MAIRAVNAPIHGEKLQLTECPLCGYAFDRHESRPSHIETHDPEDAGLSPLGTIPAGHETPLAVTSNGRDHPDPEATAGEVLAR